ncbi:MAG: hypothetical protein JO287_23830 [Pseudonocardiales bacterium]|nr:hypothetical protein [Pseudonocardiales bacterium]
MTRSDTGRHPPDSSASVELEAVQTATRWLVGAAAAVLAVLLAGVQLSSMGQLASEQPGRLVVAVIACVVGLAAVGIILVLAARVLVSPGWTLGKLAHLELQHKWQDHWLRSELEAQRGLLDPDEDIEPDRLYRRHRRLLVAWFQLQEQGHTSLPDDLNTDHDSAQQDYLVTNDHDVERLRSRLEEVTAVTERIATAANLADTRRRYRFLVQTLPIIGVLPVIAVPVFAWATTLKPEPAITTPTAIHITFVRDRSVLQQAGLPADCAGRDINAIAVDGSLPHPIVVSTSDPRCILNQVRITPSLGTAVPTLPSR